jgi:hypothetical protein
MLCYYAYIIMLRRTTIVLPQALKEIAQDRARSRGISFGEFVRRAVEEATCKTPRGKSAADPFLSDRAVFRGGAPSDLSERHDFYLYGGR